MKRAFGNTMNALSIAAAAMPFLTGLLGAPILAAVFAPLH